MKKFLILFLIMTTLLFSQSWNNTVATSISEPNAEKMDLFTNRDGNHLIVQNSNSSNSLKYYLLNSSGSIVRSATIETSGSAEFPNISGDNDKVYIIYKLGSNLKLKKSTNAGQNWASLDNQGIGSNTCNGVDIVYDYRGVHVVYAMKDNGSDYETYYRNIGSNDIWSNREDVTDYGTEVGGFPTIAVSSNRIHVGYNNGNVEDPFENYYGDAKTRDKYNSTWQTPQSVTLGGGEESAREKVQVRTDKLYNFFYDLWCDLGNCGYELKVKSRNLGGTSWSSSTSLNSVNNPSQFMGAEQTANSELHVVYGDWEIYHKYYNGAVWSSEYELTSQQAIGVTFGFSYVSNDLYCIWKERDISNFKYAQYDATPLAPTNFTGTNYNNRPKLTWDKIEPDIEYFEIWRRFNAPGYPGGWNLLTTTTSTSFIDNEIWLGGSSVGSVLYKIKSKDIGNHFSSYTNVVFFKFSGINKIASRVVLFDFVLKNNHPNPFNPSTQIIYSLAQDADVMLKVYDMLGTEVAKLVSETQTAGIHEINFNAENLSSGVYIYRITATNNGRILFTDSKQMILLR